MLASMAPDEFATVAARVHAIAAYQTGDWRPGFPNVQIDEIRAQEGRNLDRSDIISIFLIRLLRNFRRPSS
jgi:hypothetical protein